MTKVKICGITNLEDALLSAKFGADALGFNFYEKSPRYIAPEKAREIIEQLPENVLKVGVFVNESLDKIAEIASIAKLDALQLHGEEAPEFVRELKAKTNLEIIKAFRVSPDFKPEDVFQYETDAILLDAYNPKEHGGTGETFDWWKIKDFSKNIPRLYLAGGLNHENVFGAMNVVKPFAVDACSCLESRKGQKDKVKLINFIAISKNYSNYGKKENIFDILALFHARPKMYFGEKSLTLLENFLFGFEWSLELSKGNFETDSFFNGRFYNFVSKKLKDHRNAVNLYFKILDTVDNNEEKAFDLYFALLEEFKLEKEDLSNE